MIVKPILAAIKTNRGMLVSTKTWMLKDTQVSRTLARFAALVETQTT
jgi:hypothetical protein